MDQLIANMPKGVLAFLALALALILMVRFNPPQTLCDGQEEAFRKSQRELLFGWQKKGVARKARFEELIEVCRFQAGPGGCLSLFESVRKLDDALDAFGESCEASARGVPEARKAVFSTMDAMARLAWGERGPKTYLQKAGWFDVNDQILFCRLKRRAVRLYGEEAFEEFQDRTLRSLPEAQGRSREDLMERSLFSLPCRSLK